MKKQKLIEKQKLQKLQILFNWIERVNFKALIRDEWKKAKPSFSLWRNLFSSEMPASIAYRKIQKIFSTEQLEKRALSVLALMLALTKNRQCDAFTNALNRQFDLRSIGFLDNISTPTALDRSINEHLY